MWRIDLPLNRLGKIVIIYLISVGVGIVSASIYHNNLIENSKILGEVVIGINQVRTTEIEKEKIFDTIADLENYPKILPKNVISVEIINQTVGAGGADVIFAKETVTEAGVQTTLTIRHALVPYDRHNIEVMDGNAKGTIIRLTFKETDTGTEISIESEIKIHGILAPFGLLTRPNMESAIDTTINSFIEYAKSNT